MKTATCASKILFCEWGEKGSHEGDAEERELDGKRDDGGVVRQQGGVSGRNGRNGEPAIRF